MPKTKGFTIIEVIIVLVIGAVIMLAVFVVVPQLQRTQRNSSRQNAARRVFTAGEQYAASTNVYPQANGSGASIPPQNCVGTLAVTIPPQNCTEITDITGDVKSPSGAAYTVKGSIGGTWTDSIDFMAITYNSLSCVNNVPATTPNINKFVVVVRLETSGDPTNWCVSN